MNSDLLLELGCEDLPARYVLPLANALKDGVTGGLSKRGIAADSAEVFATPRRIAVRIEAVAALQADQKIERLGPALAAALKDGQPTPAALGFAKSCGVEFAELGKKDGKLYFAKSQPGRATAELLPEIFEEVLKGMDALVPKRMRWGSGDETFVRPVQWIVYMLGGKVVPLKRFGLKAGNKTFGHRFHAPKAIVLKSPAEYEKKLRAAKVWADFESRKNETWKQIETEAKKLKGTPHKNEELLNEVTALVEWPVAISGRMEERFMQLPSEVIIATIEQNQRYFPVFSEVVEGSAAVQQTRQRMLPFFITVSNIKSKDVKQVIAGNERVVRPRLTDALFFREMDGKKKLSEYVPSLDKVTFQKDLGSVGDKVRRVTKLAVHIAELLKEDTAAVQRAAQLCKADLLTRMVFELPELQGTMGGYYAEHSDEALEVAQAIREHYMPTHSGGGIPGSRIGRIVALADKVDTLAGIFAIGQKPTASKDPFALRRAALGALRICIEGMLQLDLKALLKVALDAQPISKHDEKLVKELWEFVLERLRAHYVQVSYQEESGEDAKKTAALPSHVPVSISIEDVAAVHFFEAVTSIGATWPTDIWSRLEAVREFWMLPQAAQLASAHKRIRNILKQAGEGESEVQSEHLREPQEKGLYEALKKLEGQVQAAAQRADYVSSLKLLAQLQQPVDAFFDKVMVMAPESELRANRIALLRQLDKLCRSVADISCLPG